MAVPEDHSVQLWDEIFIILNPIIVGPLRSTQSLTDLKTKHLLKQVASK